MNNELLRTILTVVFGLSTTASFGDVMLLNDPSLPASADGFNITRDTSTNLEWLDLDVSVGRTFDDLTGVDGSNEFIAGGDFDGFRYATHEELTGAFNGPQLDSLYKSLDISPFSFSSIGGYSSARALITIAGCFGSCTSYGYSTGIILADDGVTEAVASMEAFTSQGFNWGRSDPFSNPILFEPNNAFPFQQGNWLVRGIQVADTDSDGVDDASDNCLEVSNVNQRDTNGDGIGNWCDPDIVGDGGVPANNCLVDFFDLEPIKAAFLTNPASANWNPDADFDGDDFIGFLDVAITKAFFLAAPGPAANPNAASGCVP